MNLEKDVKGNKGFYMYIKSKRKIRGNVVLLLNRAGSPVAKDMENGDLLNAAFASVLTSNISFRNTRPWRPRGKSGARKTYPWWKRLRSGNT